MLGRRDAHHPAEGLERENDPVTEDAPVSLQLVVVDVGLVEVVGQQPEARNDAVPAPALVLQIEHLDLEHIAGHRPLDRNRPGERVNQLVLQLAERGADAVRPDLAGAFERLEDDGVAGRDR